MNWTYSIKLSYATLLSSSHVHLPRPGPTIVTSNSSPESASPPCRAHRWGGRPPFTLWLPAASICTLLWGGTQWLTLNPLPRGTTTLCLNRVFPSPPWSVAPPGGGTPPGPWASTLSPPIHWWHTIVSNAPTLYKFLPRNVPLLLSFTAPSLPFPTASKIYPCFGRPPPNRCYCRRSSVLGELFQLQMGFSFPFLCANDLRSSLLIIRAHIFLLSCT